MPNALAYVMVLGWPLIAAFLFTRLPLERAFVWTILAGYLFVPTLPVFNLPVLPSWGKDTAPTVAALALCVAYQGRQGAKTEAWRAAGWLPRNKLAMALALVFLLQPIVTVMLNTDPQRVGAARLPGLTAYDIGSFFYRQLFMLLPFLLARRYLQTDRAGEIVLKAIFMAGLAYSMLAFVEVVMAPQINNWIYDYYQFNFKQQRRGGGFRPVVFLRHGLWTALYTAMALMAAAALTQAADAATRMRFLIATGWLAAVLVMSNSFGAFVLGVAFGALMFAPSRKLKITVLAALAAVALTYPMLRGAGLFPAEQLVAMIESFDPLRAGSLGYRFDNEDMFMARANERPIFGWGGWGRARVYDDDTGKMIGATDGRWIILFGFYGWVGYVAEVGLLTLPVFLLARRPVEELDPMTIGLATLLVLNLTDMLLNATLTPLTWMLAGALYAELERRRVGGAAATAQAETAVKRRLNPVLGAVGPGGAQPARRL